MPYRMLYEDAIGKRYLELTRVDNPRFGLKFGWYLLDTETHAALDGFSLPLSEPVELATKRAHGHARGLGYRETRMPG